MPPEANDSKWKHMARKLGLPVLRSRNFFGAWMRSPGSVGAVLPSSRHLARAMAQQLPQDRSGTVIEVGAGTGVMTYALLQSGLKPDELLVVERDYNLAEYLKEHFQHLRIVCADAMQVQEVLKAEQVSSVRAVISSLPLLSMPKSVRYAIEERMVECIAGGGRIVQFTYGPKSPISAHTIRRFHLEARRVKTVLANVPPAHVWTYEVKAH